MQLDSRIALASALPLGFGEEIMAIEPSAVRGFTPSGDPRLVQRVGSIAVMRIEGPTGRKAGWYFDGYDSIVQRFREAHASDARGVAIVGHTPGGYVSGLEEAREIMLSIKAESGKPVEWISADNTYSAGVYLSTVADRVSVLRGGSMGSVGTITTLYDYSKMLASMGITPHVISSGEQKADGHPDIPLTEAALARIRSQIDFYSGLFFEAVSRARGLTVEEVRAQQAGIFMGEGVVQAKLADAVVASVDDALAAFEQRVSGRTTVALATGRSAQQQEKRSMENSMLAMALGLAATATDQEITGAIGAFRGVDSKLREVTGKATASEAFAVVEGWRENSGKLADASKQLADLKAKDDKREIEALISQGRTEGKIVAANEAKVRARYTDPASLGAWLETAMPAVPGAANAGDKQPEAKRDERDGVKAETPTHNGKTWAQLTHAERAALYNTDKALYEAMRASHEVK